MTSRVEELHDLAVLASLAEDLTHQHLHLAEDHDGRPTVLVPPTAAAQLATLVREIARRARRPEAGT